MIYALTRSAPIYLSPPKFYCDNSPLRVVACFSKRFPCSIDVIQTACRMNSRVLHHAAVLELLASSLFTPLLVMPAPTQYLSCATTKGLAIMTRHHEGSPASRPCHRHTP
jgi:hypothetical protein